MNAPHADARVLLDPGSDPLRFLPEGPYPAGPGVLSWVAIQHGPAAAAGSLNLLDLASGANRTFDLPGRPGFAFPTTRPGVFVVGLERRLALFDTASGALDVLAEGIDDGVAGTIINDGVCFAEGLVFGCKDLQFAAPKAGLYFWRARDRRLFRLRSDQICSNGKIMTPADGDAWTLYDIDTPTKTVVRYQLDTATGQLGEPELALDLRDGDVYPDGMCATPDGRSVIISMYNPQPAPWGETRQYRLADGALEFVWRTPGSPQATCPQLVAHEGRVWLIVTTAVEHMPAERRAAAPRAGCLFIAETPFASTPDTPALRWE